MNRCFSIGLVLFSASLALAAEDNVSRIAFSDPGKPGTLRITLARGDVTIEGAETSDVTVKSDVPQPQRRTNKEGLRVLTEAASFSLAEKDNVVTLDAASDGWMGSPSDFKIRAPRGTNIVITSAMGGNVSCDGLIGDIEVKSIQGDVRLNNVAGAVLVETMSGEIEAGFRELRDGKSISFTSMNGKVVLRLPGNAKANVRLRTQNGTIATDFDDKTLITKVESVPGHGHKGAGVLSAEAREAFRQAARAGAEAAKRVAEAAREAAEAAREGAEGSDPHRIPPPPPVAPHAPMLPTIPAVTGGKLVTGALNGGGPEINVATMNGDVTLRQLK